LDRGQREHIIEQDDRRLQRRQATQVETKPPGEARHPLRTVKAHCVPGFGRQPKRGHRAQAAVRGERCRADARQSPQVRTAADARRGTPGQDGHQPPQPVRIRPGLPKVGASDISWATLLSETPRHRVVP
jgi:hypothetical protein